MTDVMELTRNDLVSVGASSTEVFSKTGDSGRRVYYIRNTSTGGQVITLNLGHAAVANYGIVLAPGDYILDSDIQGYECWQGAIFAIASAAGGQLSVFER